MATKRAGMGRSASRRLALADEATRVGTWHWDLVTGEIERDAALDELLGAEHVPGPRTFEDYLARVHPDDLPFFGRGTQQAIAERREQFTTEHRIVRPDGEVRWMQVRAHLLLADDGSPLEAVGITVDVTEHREGGTRPATHPESGGPAWSDASTGRRLALLSRAADLLDSPLDLGAALQQVANLAIGVLADWCTVDVVSEGKVRHAAVAHRDPAMVARARELQRRYPQDIDDPAYQQLLGTLEPQFVHRVDSRLIEERVADPALRDILRDLALTSHLRVPLVSRGRGIGSLSLAACHGRLIDPGDIALAADLGRRAGSAIERVRLYEELRRTSEVLQTSLLPPRLPSIPGVDLSAHYRSGTVGLQIGGDFYDVFSTGADRWWLVLGDVCGKGPTAAAVTAAVRYAVRALATDADDPAAVLRRLNDVLLAQEPDDGQFTSVVLATFRASPGPVGPLRLAVASAGHPAPLHHTPGLTPELLACSGTVVGLVPDIEVSTVEVDVQPGDCLLLYTDGATEARTAAGMLGEAVLGDLLAAHAAGVPDGRAARVANALLTLTDGVLHDDLALLTLAVPAR
jgi:serine phosphatase RsbU (regulator of sigma subunit)